MFCPNCGAQLEDGDVFCGECGAKIQQQPEQKTEETVKQTVEEPKVQQAQQNIPNQTEGYAPKKKSAASNVSPKAKKIIGIQIAVLAVLIGVFFYFGSKSSKPEAAVNQFVDNYNDHKWEKVYPAYDMEESDFINEETFAKTMDQSDPGTLSEATGGYVQNGQYIFRINRGSGYMMAYVTKSAKKTFLFFDKYEVTKIVDSKTLTRSIRVPKIPGLTTKIDGIKVKEESSDSSSSITSTSQYVKVFAGTHKVSFSDSEGLFKKNTYTLNTETGDSYNLVNQIEYSDKAKNEAAQALKGYLPAITEAKIKNAGTAGLTSYFATAEKANIYGTTLCRYIYYTGSDAKGLGNVQLTKCEAVAPTSYRTVADGVPVSVSGTRSYQYKTWSGSYQQQTCTISGTAYMLKQNGKWVINVISYY